MCHYSIFPNIVCERIDHVNKFSLRGFEIKDVLSLSLHILLHGLLPHGLEN
jgi:hypothetical protein